MASNWAFHSQFYAAARIGNAKHGKETYVTLFGFDTEDYTVPYKADNTEQHSSMIVLLLLLLYFK